MEFFQQLKKQEEITTSTKYERMLNIRNTKLITL